MIPSIKNYPKLSKISNINYLTVTKNHGESSILPEYTRPRFTNIPTNSLLERPAVYPINRMIARWIERNQDPSMRRGGNAITSSKIASTPPPLPTRCNSSITQSRPRVPYNQITGRDSDIKLSSIDSDRPIRRTVVCHS